MTCVEAFTIKTETSDQNPFWRPIKGSRTAKVNGSRTHGCNLAFEPLKSSTQEPQKGTIQQLSPIKSLDPGCKRLNRWHLSDYPFVLHCNKLLVLVGNRLAHKLGTTSLSTVFNIKILTEPVGFFLHECSIFLL